MRYRDAVNVKRRHRRMVGSDMGYRRLGGQFGIVAPPPVGRGLRTSRSGERTTGRLPLTPAPVPLEWSVVIPPGVDPIDVSHPTVVAAITELRQWAEDVHASLADGQHGHMQGDISTLADGSTRIVQWIEVHG